MAKKVGKREERVVDWSHVDVGTNCVVIDNGDGTETRHYRPIRDAADLEARMRADGITIVDRPVLSDAERMAAFVEMYENIKTVRSQREAYAKLASAERAVTQAGGIVEHWHQTLNFYRDKRGNLLSAELEFVSQASAFHGASNDEIVATLWPESHNERGIESALDRVRQMKAELRKRNIVVR